MCYKTLSTAAIINMHDVNHVTMHVKSYQKKLVSVSI